MTTQAACTNSVQVANTALRYLAEDRAVPGRDLLRNEPSQAAKSRPLRTHLQCRSLPPPLEMIVRSPGTLISRSQPAPDARESQSRTTIPRCAHRAGISRRPGLR